MTEVIKVEDCGEYIGDYDVPIYNAILIPKNATNGDVIKALFAEYPVLNTLDGFTRMIDPIHNLFVTGRFHNDWWNAPYSAESEDKEWERKN